MLFVLFSCKELSILLELEISLAKLLHFVHFQLAVCNCPLILLILFKTQFYICVLQWILFFSNCCNFNYSIWAESACKYYNVIQYYIFEKILELLFSIFVQWIFSSHPYEIFSWNYCSPFLYNEFCQVTLMKIYLKLIIFSKF